MSDEREMLAEVLAAHRTFYDQPRGAWVATEKRWYCSCGEQIDDNYSGTDIRRRHEAHIADHLARLIAAAKAEALREAADELDTEEAPDDDRWTASLLGYHGEGTWLRDRAARFEAEQ